MTRGQSVEVLNDSTTLQSRIDTVLAAPVMAWDHSPEIGWQPGDPLYEHPWVSGATQYVRHMFDLIDEPDGRYERCSTCEVSWDGPEACWVCGDPDTARPDRPGDLIRAMLAPGMVAFDETHAWREFRQRYVESMASFTERTNEVTYHFTLDQAGMPPYVDPTEPEPEPQSWIRANAESDFNPAAPTVAEIEAATPVDAFIAFPAGAEMTAVQLEAWRRRPRGYGGRWPEIRRYYLNRPVTESRRPRETR